MTRRHPIPQRLNALIIVVQLTAIAGCFLACREAESWVGLAVAALAFALVMNSVYAVIHEAEHGMLFSHPALNESAGVLMALFFPAPFHLLRQGHIGHHLRNRSDDEAFDLYFEGEQAAWKYLQLYGILTGFYWLVAVLGNIVVLLFPSVLTRERFTFDRPSAAFMASLNPRYNTLMRAEAVAVLVVHPLIVWLLGIPVLNYAAMYAAFGFSWSAMQYVHHFGTTRHVLEGARNLWLWRPVDMLWLNHNWHLTHHKHPTVPWIHLQRIGSSENPECGFLPVHYLRMWRGPSRATDRVENRYAGRIIR
jgi:fatty acid desaturase